MDALSHCLEAFFAPGLHPMADGIALEGVRLIHEALPRAIKDGGDLEARGQMMIAAAMGATAFQKGLGAMHALSHPIGALCNSHHGLTNAVLMPYVLAWNSSAIAERAERLARYVGLEPATFDGLLEWVVRLREQIGIPATLGGIGVAPDSLDQIAEMAETDPSAAGNPLPFDAASAREVLDMAWEGRLAR
jgi:alcohol dehydrogenase